MNQETSAADTRACVACPADLFAIAHDPLPVNVDLSDDHTEIDEMGPQSVAEIVQYWDVLE